MILLLKIARIKHYAKLLYCIFISSVIHLKEAVHNGEPSYFDYLFTTFVGLSSRNSFTFSTAVLNSLSLASLVAQEI